MNIAVLNFSPKCFCVALGRVVLSQPIFDLVSMISCFLREIVLAHTHKPPKPNFHEIGPPLSTAAAIGKLRYGRLPPKVVRQSEWR